jgi:hypothetical protein
MVVGIDLGTTNSAIGIWRDGRAQLIPNSLGSVLTPSAVSVDDGGEFVIGLAARERQITHPTLTATSFKRFMGSNRSILLGARHTLRPEELSAMVLRSLKADAEVFLSEPVVEAVITVPAYFNDKQRKATRRAAVLFAVVLCARTPSNLMTDQQGKIRYFILYLPALFVLQSLLNHEGRSDLLKWTSATHLIQIIAAWLMVGVIVTMAMVNMNQRKIEG